MNTRWGSQDRMPYCFIYAFTYLYSIEISVDIPYFWLKICEQKTDSTDVTATLLISNFNTPAQSKLPAGTFEIIERSFNPLPGIAEIDRRSNFGNLRAACLCIALPIRFVTLLKWRHLNLGCKLNFFNNFFSCFSLFLLCVKGKVIQLQARCGPEGG